MNPKYPLCNLYPECIDCPKLISTDPTDNCAGPNFLLATPQELIEWARARKDHMRLTNAKIAELSGMSLGTVNGVFAGTHSDFKFGTISPIIKALIGSVQRGNPCPDPEGALDAELRAENAQLKQTVAQQESRIADYIEEIALLRKHNETTAEEMKNTAARQADTRSFLQAQISVRNKALAIMGALLVVFVFVTVALAAMH